MLKATIEIDNNTAHSVSPIEFVKKFILKDVEKMEDCGDIIIYKNPHATITVKRLRQI